MELTTKERTQLFDFLVTHEMLDDKFILQIKTFSHDVYSAHSMNFLFVQLMQDYYNAIKRYRHLLNETFTDIYNPIQRIIFHALDEKKDITSCEEFIARLSSTSNEELKTIFNKGLFDSDEVLTEEEFFKKVKELNSTRETKFTLLSAYSDLENFRENFITILKNVYPIFLEHYKKAEELFEKRISEVKKATSEDINTSLLKIFGSEKLDELYYEYHDKKLADLVKNPEFIPLIMAQNRIIATSKNDRKIFGLGLQTFGISERLEKADEKRKNLLKALSDDTRFEILRMINFGFNTNKKLSEFFKISPPAITYQTNILKKADLIEISEDGIIFLKKEILDEGFNTIKSLFDITGEA